MSFVPRMKTIFGGILLSALLRQDDAFKFSNIFSGTKNIPFSIK